MARKGLGDLISLDKSEQKKLNKENKKLKKGIKEGKIPLRGEKKRRDTRQGKDRGLIYICHLPHGFYEEEMRSYFSQFGKVTRVKVCRSSKTGRSKGYGYIEFLHPEVAKIAAESMNNYLMFKKRVVAEYVPFERRPPYLFKGIRDPLAKPSVVLRRERQFEADLNLSKEKYDERLTKRMTRLGRKLSKLNKYGVATEFLPVNVSDATREKLLKRATMKLRRNPRTRNNEPGKFVKVKKELDETSVLGKSLETVKAMLDLKSTPENKPLELLPLKVDKSTETKKTTKPIKKKKKKDILSSLNTDTVKRIARELVRKKGPSLLVYPKPVAKSTPKNKNKKTIV